MEFQIVLIFIKTLIQTESLKLLDSDNEEPNDAQSNVEEVTKVIPCDTQLQKSIAREIREGKALKARREKHAKMIAQNKTKCKKKIKKECVISGGKKRRKTKKKKERKTRRKRKSKKSKKRRRTCENN